MKQAFTYWSFGKRAAPEDLLSAAAEIGFDAVELIDEDLFPLAKSCGLSVATHRAHDSIETGLNRKAHHADIFEAFDTNLRLATRWNIPNLICFSGNGEGLSDEEGAAVIAEGLRRMAPLAEDAGVTLVLELLNSKVDHPDYQCDNTAFGVKVIELVGSPNVKLLYDIYHMQVMEGDVIRTIRDNHQHFGHYHTAGNPGRQDLDGEQEINYPPIFRAIQATGFTGHIGHEFSPKGEAEKALREAFALCEGSSARL